MIRTWLNFLYHKKDFVNPTYCITHSTHISISISININYKYLYNSLGTCIKTKHKNHWEKHKTKQTKNESLFMHVCMFVYNNLMSRGNCLVLHVRKCMSVSRDNSLKTKLRHGLFYIMMHTYMYSIHTHNMNIIVVYAYISMYL